MNCGKISILVQGLSLNNIIPIARQLGILFTSWIVMVFKWLNMIEISITHLNLKLML